MHDIKPSPDVYAHPLHQQISEMKEKKQIPTKQLAIAAVGVIALAGIAVGFSSSDNNNLNSAVKTVVTGPAEEKVALKNTEPKQAEPQPEQIASSKPESVNHGPPIEDPSFLKSLAESMDQGVFLEGKWASHKIVSGDSLSTIFEKLGLDKKLLYRITSDKPHGKKLVKIRPGQELKAKFDYAGRFEQLIWNQNAIDSLIVMQTEDGLKYTKEKADLNIRKNQAMVVINNSLFYDGQKAGLSDKLIMNLASIFGWDIDFALGIRKGDQFSLIYEERLLENGKKYNDGNILAAEFVNQGKRYRAIRYETPNGDVGYFTPNGKSLRKAFIRTPVRFSRISSGFTRKRWHPVLKRWRSHKGVDYAAPTGTPIKATGNGKIVFSGWKSGYGRVVYIQHGSKYKTVYGHLSKFSKRAKVGKRVSQGDIIGYVGKSGLATGPHLHYEMRVNGVHRNPLKVKLPSSKPIPAKHYLAFSDHANELIAQLAMISNDMIAQQTKEKKSITQ